MRTAEWLCEAIAKKELARYGDDTHLLIDNQGWGAQAEDLQRALCDEKIDADGFEAVWVVSPDEDPAATLLLSTPEEPDTGETSK